MYHNSPFTRTSTSANKIGKFFQESDDSPSSRAGRTNGHIRKFSSPHIHGKLPKMMCVMCNCVWVFFGPYMTITEWNCGKNKLYQIILLFCEFL